MAFSYPSSRHYARFTDITASRHATITASADRYMLTTEQKAAIEKKLKENKNMDPNGEEIE